MSKHADLFCKICFCLKLVEFRLEFILVKVLTESDRIRNRFRDFSGDVLLFGDVVHHVVNLKKKLFSKLHCAAYLSCYNTYL